MSDNLKDLFKTRGDLTSLDNKSVAEIADETNSSPDKYVDARSVEDRRFIPHIDFSSASNFVKFGSAERYYGDAIDRIIDFYPYDGSGVEKLQWQNSSSYLDLHIFDNEYPRTNGYITIASDGYAIDSEELGNPTTKEYIVFYGGPNTASSGMIGKTLASTFSGSNVFDAASDRESNLKFDLSGDGATVEFWVKLGELDPDATTDRQVIFDLTNNEPTGTVLVAGSPLGRFQLYYYNDRTAGNSGLNALLQSGTISQQTKLYTINDGLDLTTTGSWNHYAVTLQNTGSNLLYEIYQNGIWVNTVEDTDAAINEVTGALQAAVGAGIDSYYATPGSAVGSLGWWKLSGSLDEFRYWKTKRTARQIGLNWLDQVEGGVNTDDAASKLGVYYKFNEGITANTAIDKKVLDYSGRVTNGTFVGYASGARSIDSAIVEASASLFEFKDPIMYRDHPDVTTLSTNLALSGTEYDYQNVSSLYSSIPSWIQEEDDNGALKNLTQIMSSYFDNLYLQINALPTFRDNDTYTSASNKPYPFAKEMLESVGLTTPELFVDAEISEILGSRSDDKLFVEDINDVKNRIYENIYNNIVNIYKSKGTEASFKNLIKCFGVDEDVVDLKVYGNNIEFELADNLKNKTFRKNYINFHAADNFSATCYQHTSSDNANSVAYLSSSHDLTDGFGLTFEAEVILPTVNAQSVGSQYLAVSFASSSLYGIHTPNEDHAVTAWSLYDPANFQVYVTKEYTQGQPSLGEVKFVLTSSNPDSSTEGFVSELTSAAFPEGYKNKRWNLAVKVAPEAYPQSYLMSGSIGVNATTTMQATGGLPSVDETIIITDYAGTAKTYTAKAAEDLAAREFNQSSTAAALATSLAACINATDGHNGTIAATAAGTPGVCQLTQSSYGTSGNTDFDGSTITDIFLSASFVGGTIGVDYKVEFYGSCMEYDIVQHSFYVTSSMSQAQGQLFLSSSKRVYAGAHKTDFTGSTLEQSDVRISSVRAWLDVLSNDEVLAHAKDPTSFGRLHPYRQAFMVAGTGSSNSVENYIPRINTRMLDWDFALVTGSSATGEFAVADVSSGSLAAASGSGWLGNMLHLQHPGVGYGFSGSATNVISNNYIYAQKQRGLENLDSTDMIKVLSNDDVYFDRNSRPINYFFSIEKSIYDAVSREMLEFFATIVDFNNLIGDTPGRYRQEYKPLEKLRQLFFERVENETIDFEKYLQYYKWIDQSLSIMLRQLIPASARFSEGVRTMIDSHVLERNKYRNKFPMVENKLITDPAGPMTSPGVGGGSPYPWKYGHAPVDLSQDENCFWWKHRAEPTASSTPHIFDAGIDSDRTDMYTSIVQKFDRQMTAPVQFSAVERNDIKSGQNSLSNNHKEKSVLSSFSNIENEADMDLYEDYVYITGSNLEQFVDCSDLLKPTYRNQETSSNPAGEPASKKKVFYQSYTGHDSIGQQTGSRKENTPLSFYSSSMTASGYVVEIQDVDGFEGLDITNLHDDSYGSNLEIPMQGPFTEKYVGGYQYRHVDVNYRNDDSKDYLDNLYTRPEGYRIVLEDEVGGAPGAIVVSGPAQARTGTLAESAAHFDNTAGAATGGKGFVSVVGTNLDMTADFTVAAWIQTSTNYDATLLGGNILQIREGTTNRFHILIDEDNKLGAGVNAFGTVEYTTVINDGEWHHFALTFDDTTNDLKLYVDGVERDSATLSLTISTADAINIGVSCHPTGPVYSHPYVGYMGEMAIFNEELSATQVSELYSNDWFVQRYGGTATGRMDLSGFSSLQAWWQFGDDLTADSSGNSNTLALATGGATQTTSIVPPVTLAVDPAYKYLPFANRIRETYAKRPVNIANIQQVTSSGITKIGNFEKNYQVVQTSGRKANNLFIESLSITNSESLYVTGVIDYSLPERSTNKTVITERFSAPGSGEVMARGTRDHTSEEYSPYNALPWRNLSVRQPLNSLLREPSGQYGIRSGTVSSSFFDASERYMDDFSLLTGSYHKTNRNPRVVKKFVEESIMTAQSTVFDGTDDFLEFGAGSGANFSTIGPLQLANNGEISVFLWIKTTDDSGIRSLVRIYDSEGSNNPVIVSGRSKLWFYLDDGELTLYFGDPLTGLASGLDVSDGEWHLVGFTYEFLGTTPYDPVGSFSQPARCRIRAYLDGAVWNTTTDVQASWQLLPTDSIVVGSANTNADTGKKFFKGNMSELGLWDKALTPQEVKDLQGYKDNDLVPGATGGVIDWLQHTSFASLSAWWRFGDSPDDGANIVRDASRNGRRSHTSRGSLVIGGSAAVPDSGSWYTASLTQDNWFIQHAIPQRDSQYMWITASLLRSPVSGNFNMAHQMNYATSSDELKFVQHSEYGSYNANKLFTNAPLRYWGNPQSASLIDFSPRNIANFGPGPGFIPTDFAGMNTNIYEPLTSSQNLLGYDISETNLIHSLNTGGDMVLPVSWAATGSFIDRISANEATEASASVLNSILLHRNGPYQYPSWKQIRAGQSPIIRNQRKTNIMSYLPHRFQSVKDFGSNYHNLNDPTQHRHPSALAYYQARALTGPKSNEEYPQNRADHVAFITESVVTSKYAPLRHEFGDIASPDHVLIADTYGNNLVTFTRYNKSTKNNTAIESFGINTEPVRDEQIHTTLFRESMPPDQQIGRITYRETVFPREKNAYLKKVRQRENFIVDFWHPLRSHRTETNVSNSMGVHYQTATSSVSEPTNISIIQSQSMWVLDGRIDPFVTGASLMPSSRNAEGELLNRYSLNHGGTPANLQTGSCYGRNGIDSLYSVIWEAGAQAGKNPFYYDSYEGYIEDVKRYGKAYTVIPEFRISDYMDYYVVAQDKNFSAPLPPEGFLSLTGAVLNEAAPPDAMASSSMASFFDVYSTTDFLEHFKPIVAAARGVDHPTQLTLECNAVMKFLPYKGFYPAQRTVELASLFSQSYGKNIQFSSSVSGETGTGQASMRTFLQPFFAPGILYNTIKGGVACDFPIYTGSATDARAIERGTNGSAINTSASFRIPFEALVEPEWLRGQQVVDIEVTDADTEINSTASWGGDGDDRYKLAMHNFLAESINFFLKDGQLSSFASAPDGNGFRADPTKTYIMDIAMYPGGSEPTQQHGDIMYNIGTTFGAGDKAYGPRVQFYDNAVTDGVSYPFAPPYYSFAATARITFDPPRVDDPIEDQVYSLNEILNASTIKYYHTISPALYTLVNGGLAKYGVGPAFNDWMQLDATLNLSDDATRLTLVNAKDVSFNAISGAPENLHDGDGQALVFQTRFETPILDFTSASLEAKGRSPRSPSGVSTANTVRGMWHQYGVDLDGETGIFWEIRDSQASDVDDKNKFLANFGKADVDESLTGSLADLIQMPKRKIKLGQSRVRKVIKEAVIAIPFMPSPESPGGRQYYTLDSDSVANATERISQGNVPVETSRIRAVYEQLLKMKNYVLPPMYDFLTYEDQDSIAMYIFEFEHELSRKDVTDIWQNLPPDSISRDFQTARATISHDLMAGAFLSPDPRTPSNIEDIKWLVFKVKQRAHWNYFKKTNDTSDDERFQFNIRTGRDWTSSKFGVPDYSYNWPYDFFSLVELVKLDANVTFETEETAQTRHQELLDAAESGAPPVDAPRRPADRQNRQRRNRGGGRGRPPRR